MQLCYKVFYPIKPSTIIPCGTITSEEMENNEDSKEFRGKNDEAEVDKVKTKLPSLGKFDEDGF